MQDLLLGESGRKNSRKQIRKSNVPIEGFRDDVCSVIANGCISGPHSSFWHVSPRALDALIWRLFYSVRFEARATLPLLVIIYSYNFVQRDLPFSDGGWNETKRDRARGSEKACAVAHAFVNVCRCRHPPTYANHLI